MHRFFINIDSCLDMILVWVFLLAARLLEEKPELFVSFLSPCVSLEIRIAPILAPHCDDGKWTL